jgi:hypothetical protein
VAGATPFPKVGWPDHPIFGQGVAPTTPNGWYGVAEATPGLWGWSGHPKRPKKKKGGKMGFGLWGWPDHPQRPKRILSFFFFFFFGLLGWLDHPLGPGGGFGHPIPTVGGGWSHPLGQKWGGLATPLLGRGWQPPRFPLFFFFFFNF